MRGYLDFSQVMFCGVGIHIVANCPRRSSRTVPDLIALSQVKYGLSPNPKFISTISQYSLQYSSIVKWVSPPPTLSNTPQVKKPRRQCNFDYKSKGHHFTHEHDCCIDIESFLCSSWLAANIIFGVKNGCGFGCGLYHVGVV